MPITCSKISLGNNVIICPNTMLFADPRKREGRKIIIEDNVMIGSGVHIYVANHRYDLKDIDIVEQGAIMMQGMLSLKKVAGLV